MEPLGHVGSVVVITTEEAIDRLARPEPPPRYAIKTAIEVLTRQGQIVPIVLQDDRYISEWDGQFVYAAVELGWPTMIVTARNVTSG